MSNPRAVGTAGFRAAPWIATAMQAARAVLVLEIRRSSTVLEEVGVGVGVEVEELEYSTATRARCKAKHTQDWRGCASVNPLQLLLLRLLLLLLLLLSKLQCRPQQHLQHLQLLGIFIFSFGLWAYLSYLGSVFI